VSKIKQYSFLLWPLVILLITFSAFIFKPWQTTPKDTISVTATGKTQIIPNIAKINATIQTTNPDLDQAREENSQTVSGIVTSLENLGIENKDIQTQFINAAPGYEPEILIYPTQPRPNTNQVSTSLEITIRNFQISEEVLSALTSGGATNLYGPNLTVDDTTLEEAKSRARESAVEAAKEKAQELAKLSERKLGKVASVSEQGDFGVPIPLSVRSEEDLSTQATQIQPGQNEVTITLSVTFEVK